MPRYETISQSLFDLKCKEAIEKTPIRKEVSLKDVEVIKNDILKLGERHIKMNSDAFRGICKIVGLPVGFDKTFASAFGDKARQALVNRLKVAIQAKGATTLSLAVNPDTREIVSIQKDNKSLISNQTFINTSTSIIDKYGLEVNNISVGRDGGVVINAASPKNEWEIKGMTDESYFGGISFTNSPNGGFNVSPYVHRLVCANGMIGTAFSETFTLGQMEPAYMESFWAQLNALAERAFMPLSFETNVKLAAETRASLMELETAHKTLQFLSDAEHKELEAWVPLHTTRERFYAANIDALMLSNAQKKTAKTGTTVWDLVNGLTHFASHDNGFEISDYDRRKIQVQAGKLLTKNLDMANIVASPFA